MKNAKAKHAGAIAPRPLLELLGMRAPEDYPQRRDFEDEVEEAWKQFRSEHPLGLSPAEVNHDLNVGLDYAGGVYEKLARKLFETGKFVAYLNAHYGESHKSAAAWNGATPDFAVLAGLMHDRFHDFRLQWLERFLTPGEVARGAHEQIFSGALYDDIYKHPHQIYLHKLALSAWHWLTRDPDQKGSKIAWSKVVQFHKFFMSFDFALPGFDVTIDHSHHWCNKRGSGEYTGWKIDPATGHRVPDTWLDGEFALIISKAGVHLLTLGVCTTAAGILVNQIQLKQKKGNRWLFQLPAPYFEYALSRLYAASEIAQLPLYLVTGESHAEELGRVHAEALKADATIAPRIVGIYNQPLAGLKRGRRKLTVSTLAYRQIAAKGVKSKKVA